MLYGSQDVIERLDRAERWWLFLDYDGTLADFAPTPDHISPDPELIDILTQLSIQPDLRLSVVSGRRLDQVSKLLPINGIWLAGVYGLELRLPDGERIDRLEYSIVRPILEGIEPKWKEIIADLQGFYLEDKGWTLAIHARFADDRQAMQVLSAARDATSHVMDNRFFYLMGGHKFLEIGPRLADKGLTVDYFLDHFPWDRSIPVYAGDDDKDEKAFARINEHNGISILVSAEARVTNAVLRLASPEDVRQWLRRQSVKLKSNRYCKN